jgi:hypothetical protein
MSTLVAGLIGLGLHRDPAPVEAATINCSVASSELPADTEEQNLFTLINSYRTKPYTWSTTLSGAATWMAHDMANHSKLSHIDSYNRDVRARLTDCGYPATAPVGEDITAGMTYMFGDMATLSNWMFNSADWALIVGTQYTTVGIGRAYNSYSADKWYWVVVVGTDSTASILPTPTRTPTPVSATPLSPIATATRVPSATPTTASYLAPTATVRSNGVGNAWGRQ